MIRHQSWQADFDLSYTPPSSAADETVETVSRSKRTIVWLTSLLFFFFFRDTDERDYKLHLFSSRPFGKTHLESLLAHLFKARTTYWGKMSKYYGTRKQMSLFLHGFLSGKKKRKTRIQGAGDRRRSGRRRQTQHEAVHCSSFLSYTWVRARVFGCRLNVYAE